MEAFAQPPDEVVVAVDGKFDRPAAWKLCQHIVHVGPAERLVVDFSRAIHVMDDALATFLDRAPRLRDGFRVRGLSRHHHRLLEYLGVHLMDGIPCWTTAEECSLTH